MNSPIYLPNPAPFSSKVFSLGRKQEVSSTEGGFVQTIERRIPLWYAEYSTPPLTGDRYNKMLAFLESLEGSLHPFFGYDPRRPMPYAYRHLPITSSPWGVAPTMQSMDTANSQVTLANMPAGAIVTQGDYIQVNDGNRTHLFRSMTTGTVASSTITLVVKPRPLFTISLPKPIIYRRASATFKMIGGFEEQDSVESFPTLAWKAFQIYLPV